METDMDYLLFLKKRFTNTPQKLKEFNEFRDFIRKTLKEKPPEGEYRWTLPLLRRACEEKAHVKISEGKLYNYLQMYHIIV